MRCGRIGRTFEHGGFPRPVVLAVGRRIGLVARRRGRRRGHQPPASRAVISTSCTSARPTTSWTAWARASQAPRSRRRQRRRPAGRSRAAGGRGERSAGCVGRAPRGRGAVVQRRQCRAAHAYAVRTTVLFEERPVRPDLLSAERSRSWTPLPLQRGAVQGVCRSDVGSLRFPRARALGTVDPVRAVQIGVKGPCYRLERWLAMKRLVGFLFVALIVWLIFTQPATAANIVKDIGAILTTAAHNVTSFFTQVPQISPVADLRRRVASGPVALPPRRSP